MLDLYVAGWKRSKASLEPAVKKTLKVSIKERISRNAN